MAIAKDVIIGAVVNSETDSAAAAKWNKASCFAQTNMRIEDGTIILNGINAEHYKNDARSYLVGFYHGTNYDRSKP